jgi:hypothetical protein
MPAGFRPDLGLKIFILRVTGIHSQQVLNCFQDSGVITQRAEYSEGDFLD